jgi:predicted DNA-binding protein
METSKLIVRLPAELHKDFKLRCVKAGRSMADVVTELIKQYTDAIEKDGNSQ